MTYQERILRVLVHIQTHLDDPLSLDELAGIACFSPFHFHRIFRGIVGEPVKEHVRRLRLERAAARLKFSAQPVIDIALDAGYESHEAFTRAFRAGFGESPSAYRSGRLADAPPESPIAVGIEQVPEMRIAFIRHVGAYQEVGAAWSRLFSWLVPRGLYRADTKLLGICHDDPEVTPPDKLRYDAAVTISDSAKAEGEVGVRMLDSGEYAVAQHKGPYQKLGDTYARICGEWLPWSGRELASTASIERYLNNPQMTSPENLLTDVMLPLRGEL
jgi:AraC family transcriptional regulator